MIEFTQEQQLQVNMFAAKMLNLSYVRIFDDGISRFVEAKPKGSTERYKNELGKKFDLFTNDNDLLRVVVMLDVEYGINVKYNSHYKEWRAIISEQVYVVAETYKNAVAAGVMEAMKIIADGLLGD